MTNLPLLSEGYATDDTSNRGLDTMVIRKDEARVLLDQRLNSAFPTAESLTKKMVLEVCFKDVTFETLNDRDFMESIKKSFPNMDWEKTYKEFMAAGESESHETEG